ncbi:hypothetical protein H1_0054 [Aeromonas phage vB_AhydM-H1]|nr:hypothetical protein H1_0054 [Aeromonas phage vB_AhydM-H1]
MPAKIHAEEIRRWLSDISPAPMGELKVVIEEEYTPRDFLAQRYRVSLVAVNKGKRQHIVSENGLLNPVITIEKWMLACGLTTDDLIFKIP